MRSCSILCIVIKNFETGAYNSEWYCLPNTPSKSSKTMSDQDLYLVQKIVIAGTLSVLDWHLQFHTMGLEYVVIFYICLSRYQVRMFGWTSKAVVSMTNISCSVLCIFSIPSAHGVSGRHGSKCKSFCCKYICT